MTTVTRFGIVLKAALIAGIIAGLAVSIFHEIVTEPVIDRAIVLEEQRTASEGHLEEEVVSRQTQKLGLAIGFVLYGLTWSALLGAVYSLGQTWLPAQGAARRGWVLAALGYWSVGLIPFLKYPANPPGVGDPETITYRQSLYLGVMAFSVLGTAVAVALNRRQGAGSARAARWLPAAGVLAVVVGGLFFVVPGNPDPVTMPADLVTNFRALSLLGITLFWAVLGGLFGMQLGRLERRRLGNA